MTHLYSIKTRKTFVGYEKPSLDDVIEHHGILGMKWGKRNGPPYPLGVGDHSASEKKAGYKKSIGGGRNEELYDRKKKPSATIRTAKRQSTTYVTSDGDRIITTADREEVSKDFADDIKKGGYIVNDLDEKIDKSELKKQIKKDPVKVVDDIASEVMKDEQVQKTNKEWRSEVDKYDKEFDTLRNKLLNTDDRYKDLRGVTPYSYDERSDLAWLDIDLANEVEDLLEKSGKTKKVGEAYSNYKKAVNEAIDSKIGSSGDLKLPLLVYDRKTNKYEPVKIFKTRLDQAISQQINDSNFLRTKK